MNKRMSGAGGVFLACFLLAAAGTAGEVVSAPSAVRPLQAAAKRAELSLPHSVIDGLPDTPARLALGPLDLDAVGREDAARVSRDKTLRVGVVRDVPEPVTVPGAGGPPGEWSVLDSGDRVWRLTVRAEGACGLRVRFTGVSLPAGCELRVFAAEDPSEVRGPYTQAGLGGRVSFWSGTVFSERVTLECYVPAGVDPAAVAFGVDKVTHVYRDPTRIAKEGSCNNDVTCFPAWTAAANGVAGIGSYDYSDYIWCTGCLLNDLDDATWKDYFLTANHCVANQSEADDTEFYWFFQTATCGGGAPDISTVTTTYGGAKYLAGKTETAGSDFALLQLRNPSPDGATYAGWTTAAPVANEPVACIHHPDGAYKRISFGNNAGWDSDFLSVRFTSGVTEPGSSGSPLFNASGAVIGQLWGGSSSCENPSGLDDYGRFDVTYASISPWLEGTAPEDSLLDYLCDPQDEGLTTTGSYDGYFFNEETAGGLLARSVCGTFSLRVTRVSGALSAKAVIQKKTLSFTSKMWWEVFSDGTCLAMLSARGGERLVLYVRQDRIWGQLSGGAIAEPLFMDGARNRFAERADTEAQAVLAGYRGYYTVALPAYQVWSTGGAGVTPGGSGYLTLTIGNSGSARVAGVLSDGTRVSLSSRLVYYGDCGDWACVPLFAPLYSRKGWLGGLIWLNPSTGVAMIDADLGWFVRWEKPVTTPDSFGALLFPCGGYYNTGAPLAEHYRLNAETNAVRYHVSGLAVEPQQAAMPQWVGVDVVGTRLVIQKGQTPSKVDGAYVYTGENSARATLSFSARTGIYRGSFSHYYDYTLNGRLTHKTVSTSYAGVLTQTRSTLFDGWPEGQGYYLITDNDPVYKPYRIKRSFWMDLYIAP